MSSLTASSKMKYSEQANGSEIEVSPNEEFEIDLPETRTAGFRWTLKSGGEPACKLLDESAQPSTGATGGSGNHIWRFRAAQAGTGSIQIAYGRSWKAEAEPERTFEMKIRVRP